MEYLVHLAIIFAIYAILGISLNLVVGYTGLLSVMHAAFFGIGAYTSALLLTQLGVNFFISLLLGITLTVVASFLIGIVLSRLEGDYYMLGTVGFNFIIFSLLVNWEGITKGPLGIPAIPRPYLEIGDWRLEMISNASFLIFTFLLLVLMYSVSRYIIGSSFGRVLKAVREDEKAIQVFGYNTLYYKLAIFVIAAAMASVAGSLYASYISFIDPSPFTVMESVLMLAIIILGGLANLNGYLLGAGFLILLPELLRFVGFPSDIAAHMRQLVYGILLIILMLHRPQGLLGEYKL